MAHILNQSKMRNCLREIISRRTSGVTELDLTRFGPELLYLFDRTIVETTRDKHFVRLTSSYLRVAHTSLPLATKVLRVIALAKLREALTDEQAKHALQLLRRMNIKLHSFLGIEHNDSSKVYELFTSQGTITTRDLIRGERAQKDAGMIAGRNETGHKLP